MYQKGLPKDDTYKAKIRERNLKRVFGITTEDYQAMLEQQNYVCAICSKPESNARAYNLAVDHCHISGKVRGLLCTKCNVALGGFLDSKEMLTKAIQYLEKYDGDSNV